MNRLLSILLSLMLSSSQQAKVEVGVPPQPTGLALSPLMFDVKKFGGAVCDGTTDDTAAVEKTYAAAAAALAKPGGSGIVYFPPSQGFCKVTTLKTPSMDGAHGWLYSLFDNGLYANVIRPGSLNAFIGRTSSFGGMSGGFLFGPTAEWIQSKGESGPLVDIQAVNQLYFEGLDIWTQGSHASATVHMHNRGDRGVTYVLFKRCVVGSQQGPGPALLADSSVPNIPAGFTFKAEDSSFNSAAGTTTMVFKNFGEITIEHGYVNLGMSVENDGIASAGDVSVDDVLSEGLNGQDFLTVYTPVGSVTDITLNRVKMADCVNSWMVKHVTKSNQLVNIKISMTPMGNMGKGLIDPASTPQHISLHCEGFGCDRVLREAKNALYFYVGFPVGQPVIFFGSQYVPNPIQITPQPK